MTRIAIGALAAGLAAACGGAQEVVVGEDYQRVLDPLTRPVDALDVLFVVDTSGSMEPEARALVDAAGAQLFGRLAEDLGGMPDLRVAIVTTDVATAAPGVPGCSGSRDDGRFRIGTVAAGCPGIDGRYLIDERDGVGGRRQNFPGTLTEAFACAATVEFGTGCGFEHPLEAARRALDGRHADQRDFLRSDAMLLVVFITDEDDCSVADPAFFGDPTAGPGSPLGPLTSFRCFEFGVECDGDQPRVFGDKQGCRPREDSPYLTPVATYRDFFTSLKADPALVMITGMYAPPAPVVVGQDPEAGASSGQPALLPNCTAPATNVSAAPAVRLDALVQQFPSRFVFESMCEHPMAQRLNRITRSTTGVMSRRPCLLGRLDEATTTTRCRAHDVAPDGSARAVAGCRAQSDQGCFVVAPSAQCDYTTSGVAATFRGTLADGHRLVVDCLAPATD